MVKKRLVSEYRQGADEWKFPVLAKSTSGREQILQGILGYMSFLVLEPKYSIAYFVVFAAMFRFKLLNKKHLIGIFVLSFTLYVALLISAGWGTALEELFKAILYKPLFHHSRTIELMHISRNCVVATFALLFLNFYNKRSVKRDEVNISVYLRQKHERLRVLRRWQKNIDIKEVL
jgi:hypothetical protein